MKTIFLISTSFLLWTNISFAQIKLQSTVDSKYKTFQLEDGSLKYVIYNKNEEIIHIYNLDNTVWRTVKIPLPKNHFLDELKHISVHTINDDDLVELIYSCAIYTDNSEYEDPEQNFYLVAFTLNIINEKGEHLLKVQNSNEMELIDSKAEKKLIVYKHIGTGFKAKDETLIYSF